MTSKDKSDLNGIASITPEQFAVPHPLKNGNCLRSTPKKITLSRSRSIPGLSSSSTPKASPTSARCGTPKSGKLNSNSLSAVKLTESGTPVNSKNYHNGEPLTFQTPENCLPNRGTIHVNRDDANLSATPECFGVVHLETPHKSLGSLVPTEGHEGLSWGATEISTEDETSNLTVGVRVRPLSAREAADPTVKVVLSIKGNEVFVSPSTDSGLAHQFSYDHCFWSDGSGAKRHHTEEVALTKSGESQEEVYNTLVCPLLEKAFEGYNVCLFAYGQTGSGKSYSMMGVGLDHVVNEPKAEAGIIPRFCHQLFRRIAQLESTSTSSCALGVPGGTPLFNQITVEVSYFEIYNEKIHDLLGDSDGGTRARRVPLRVREHPVFGPHVVDLSTHGVVSYKDMQEWILVGNSRRATAATEMNDKSSRSHSIFSIILTQTEKESLCGGGGSDVRDMSRRSKINLVDLAGSERLSSQTSASGDRMREGVSINRSLLTLGKVIAALSEGNGSAKKRTFIPYRDSVLTWLLRESLGGNSRTAMLATVSPANIHTEETLSTLRYATQAATIINRMHVNESHNDRLIRELRAEIERLKALRLDCERQRRIHPRRIIPPVMRSVCVGSEEVNAAVVGVSQDEVETLRQRLKLSEDQLARAERTWAERIAEAERCKSAEIAFLRRQGLAVCLSNKKKESSSLSSDSTVQKTACLINLSPDPGLSGTLLYILPPGNVRIGRVPNSSEEQVNSQVADILLEGPLVAIDHCVIENNEGKLMLHPGTLGSCDTYVNGHSTSGDRFLPLQHGDRLVIGGNHFFLVNNPSEQLSMKSRKSSSHFVDFEFAKQELKKVQEERLNKELEEAKQNAVKELQKANEEAEKKLSQQRLAFEKQINTLGHTLVQQKEMLEGVERAKGELEHQKRALEAELQRGHERRKAAADKALATNLSPYRSNFFQDLEDILNRTEGEEANTSLNAEEERSKEGVSLHEMQFMVKEANGLCRNHAFTYEFQHVQVLSTDGILQPKVKVCNLERKAVIYWHQDHFIHTLNCLRDYEEGDSIQDIFDCSASWEAEEEELRDIVSERGGGFNGCHTPTRRADIVIETGCVTKVLNDSISQLSSSLLQEDNNDLTSSRRQQLMERMSIGRGPEIADCSSKSSQGEVEDEVHAALFAIEEATEDLLAIFSRACLPLVSDPISAIEEFEAVMHKMKAKVERSLIWTQGDLKGKGVEGTEGWQEDEGEVLLLEGERHKPSCINMTPVKSSLRSPACTESSGGPKKVRFFFPDVNE